jgi:hypothetical protein
MKPTLHYLKPRKTKKIKRGVFELKVWEYGMSRGFEMHP